MDFGDNIIKYIFVYTVSIRCARDSSRNHFEEWQVGMRIHCSKLLFSPRTTNVSCGGLSRAGCWFDCAFDWSRLRLRSSASASVYVGACGVRSSGVVAVVGSAPGPWTPWNRISRAVFRWRYSRRRICTEAVEGFQLRSSAREAAASENLPISEPEGRWGESSTFWRSSV